MTSRISAVAVVAAILLAACGGGSDDAAPEDTSQSEMQSDTAVPVATAVVETTVPAPMVTNAPEPVVTSVEAPVATSVEAPVETTADVPDAAFCSAAENFFVPARALDFGDINDPAVLGGVIGLLDGMAQPVIDNAPAEADAALFVQSQGLLDLAAPALASIGFDLERSGELSNNVEVGEALVDFGGLLGEMQAFLIDRCGSSSAGLDDRAMAIAAELAINGTTTTIPDVVTPEPVDSAGDFTPLENDSGDLSLDVPPAWTDVTGAPEGDLQQVAAAPNLQAFLDSYTQPGVLLLTGDAATPDSWQDGLATTVGIAVDDGCTITDTSEYDDGVYTGEENLLTCGDPDSVAHLIGGRNEAGTLFFLLAIVRPTDDPEVRNRIVQSFFID